MKNTPILQYQTDGELFTLEVNLNEETVWLSQKHKGLLFDRDYKTVSKHIRNVFKEGELEKRQLIANFATTAEYGKPIRLTTTTSMSSSPLLFKLIVLPIFY